MARPWNEQYLDLILVPSGLILMFGYHLILVYRYLKCPENTVIGYENHNKRAWTRRMFQVDVKDRGPAVSVISGNISAATAMSSISLVLTSLLGAWAGSSDTRIFSSNYIYGSTAASVIYIKYVSILACFLVAFACFVQTARRFVHAIFLISMPDNDIPVGCVVKEIISGSNFWNAGLRSLYLAVCMVLWIFGPIPMFVCSAALVGMLVNVDRNTTKLHNYKW
ncbi:uncharacterized protein LOC127247915 isoform X2 [Andrographis paniculata]|uniref:uncharacterized protein LOC127247915 isoform X2 n=1 Tax=Andrographis paniculata TaxID=175694 RepID=UPI0021E721AD|nr:uncharacterized protein LOC127247915 isoform X2 [Andrographis paniculata]